MDAVFGDLQGALLVFAVAIGLLAGFVKGAVGFAMPMIMISGLASILPPEVALAALIVPTVLSNGVQAMRNGLGAAWESVKRFRLYLIIVLVFILGAAQLVTVLPSWAMFLILGVPITLFAISQLLGWQLRIRPEHRMRAEVLIGSVAGFVGGISGVWGPPTVAYLTAIETPKAEQMRVQGVVYGAGAVMLLLAHLRSGVLNADTAPLSVFMVLPAMAGMVVGMWVSDRLDQDRFRKATLAVLVIAGLNLIRRGVLGM
ncbi:sulfite exporter TauE/SafE family protein [Anianabacter salinae]|uniref:sulfite exporter TauE/SafE family protein n=1 Tax=Anianabacter salinae TaxID=2851023 RepID=UPI00225E170D|nr:sulfite exporter TauE/SafE family protein [Anianabacter salinae]MBV0913195.1 sulfite exporter TauE/SafE family protein [Anianabacter salinae]